MNSFRFKENFLLGVSTASTQIEGGEVDNNWQELYNLGLINDNTSPSVADDHYNRWEEDTNLLKEMGMEIYRCGFEWARIEPKMGEYDEEVIGRYRKEIELIISKGIKPLITLHHFSNPMWFERLGGFTKKENVQYFLDYAKKIIEAFGDIISDYVTVNEPNVYASTSFMFGDWYPNHKKFGETFEVISNLAYVHIELYKYIHEYRENKGYGESFVSFANHVRVFDPASSKYTKTAKLIERLYEKSMSKAFYLGKFEWPLKNNFKVPEGEYADYIGINYYSRSYISGFTDGAKPNTPKNDLGWEIYPNGIVRATQKQYNLLKRPIWVTENGTCDANDKFRCKYLYDHLKAMHDSKLPFMRYYHWCFLDNWEWKEGQSARFGLVHNNYETQERTIKKSGKFFMEMINYHGVTSKMYEEYVQNEEYNIK